MTGYRSKLFRHSCEGGKKCYYAALPEWDDIVDCFPRKIHPTDIDGMVEMNGQFLFLEEKGCGVSLDTGQRLALKRLSTNPNTTVVVFRPGGSKDMQVMIFRAGESTGFRDCSRAQFLHWVQRWARDADNTGRSAS